MAARRTVAGTAAGAETPPKRRVRTTRTRRPRAAAKAPRLVEDDIEVLAAEHAARDAELLDLVARLSA
jgi:hypothetical protein